jgi:hypothetical protein
MELLNHIRQVMPVIPAQRLAKNHQIEGIQSKLFHSSLAAYHRGHMVTRLFDRKCLFLKDFFVPLHVHEL